MNVNILIDSYVKWLKDQLSIREIGSYYEITTPFLDRHNDCIQIFLLPEDENNFILTDDGYIINDLSLSDFKIDTPKRKEILSQILNIYGVTIDDHNALTIKTTKDTFPIKKHFLIQAMLSITDMFMTSRNIVTSLFYEDVQNFLDDYDIRFISNAQFTGKSGYVHNFDFVIPPSKKKPERLIKAINIPNKDNTTANLFSWDDTNQARKHNSSMFVFLNDSERNIKSDILNAYIQYHIKPILWSKRTDKNIIEELVS